MSGIDILKERVDRLKKLLDEPEPGLSTWCLMLSDSIKEISAFTGEAKEWFKTDKPLPDGDYGYREDKLMEPIIFHARGFNLFSNGRTILDFEYGTYFKRGEFCKITFPK